MTTPKRRVPLSAVGGQGVRVRLSKLAIDVLYALRDFTLDGVAGVTEQGQDSGTTFHAYEHGVPELWLRAYLTPIDPKEPIRLWDAIREL